MEIFVMNYGQVNTGFYKKYTQSDIVDYGKAAYGDKWWNSMEYVVGDLIGKIDNQNDLTTVENEKLILDIIEHYNLTVYEL